jgi:hypothetical protein
LTDGDWRTPPQLFSPSGSVHASSGSAAASGDGLDGSTLGNRDLVTQQSEGRPQFSQWRPLVAGASLKVLQVPGKSSAFEPSRITNRLRSGRCSAANVKMRDTRARTRFAATGDPLFTFAIRIPNRSSAELSIAGRFFHFGRRSASGWRWSSCQLFFVGFAWSSMDFDASAPNVSPRAPRASPPTDHRRAQRSVDVAREFAGVDDLDRRIGA